MKITKDAVIGICTTSHVAKKEEYANTLSKIKSYGFRIQESNNLYKDTYTYLATPQERADDFNQLISDMNVEMVLFGGGEGGNEVLPYLDYENIKKNPKCICSFSDGTTVLDAIYAKTGVPVFYGQAPHLFDDFSEYDCNQFFNRFVNNNVTEHVKSQPWKVQTIGKAQGILIGGYLRNFAMLLNNKYFPLNTNESYILFLEDHEVFGGVDYISSMISHIEQYDFIHQVKGLLFGHYSEKEHPELLARVKRFGEKYKIPTACCDDFGHGKNHAIIPIGQLAELDTQTESLKYLI